MRDDGVASVKEVLGAVTRRLGIGGATEIATIWRGWDDIVGAEVAAHAEPTSLRDGVLRIRTDSPVWATEIGYLSEEIRRRANAAVGADAVRDVRLWIGRPGTAARRGTEAAPGRRARERTGGSDPMGALARAKRAWEMRRRA